MRHDRDTALNHCLAWLRRGMDVASCLERYPEYAEELRPLLMLAVEVGRVIVPAVPAAARAAGENRMLAAYAQREERRAKTRPVVRHARRLSWTLVPGRPGSLRPAWPVVVAALLVVLVGISSVTVATSAGSLPGDALYPIKLASQRFQLALTLNPIKHGLLADRLDTQRRLDVQAVLKGGSRAQVEFQGTLQRMEENLWFVGGLPVTVQETTMIVGLPYPGAQVRVRGELPGDGQLIALWVRVESEMAPWPTPTAEPSQTLPPTTTPTPTATPTPTSTPEPTRTPGDIVAPASGDTQVRTETSETRTPESDTTPEPGATPASAGLPELPETRDEEDMPDSIEAPEPADLPEIEDTPEPSGTGETPEHTGTPEKDEEPEEGETSVSDDEPEDGETRMDDDEPEDGEAPVDDDEPEDGVTRHRIRRRMTNDDDAKSD